MRNQISRNLAEPVESNIRTVAELERKFDDKRSATDKISDLIAGFTGSIWFVALHILWFAAWFIINSGLVPGIPKFDPYPFILLAMIVSVEAVILSTFVLMKQNRMQRKTDQRDHLNLQIDLLAEKELTKVLQVLTLICRKLEIEEADADKELKEMARLTSVNMISERIERDMPSAEA